MEEVKNDETGERRKGQPREGLSCIKGHQEEDMDLNLHYRKVPGL